jgi:AcrR family transcriptional regulator
MVSKRKPLSRDRILKAGLALADESGIDAVSMRKLGQALGYEAMSLYNHVANKDDLLDGMLDLVLGEMEPAHPGEGLPGVRRSAISAHEALTRHLWAAALLMTPTRIRPGRLVFMDALLRALREAGFSPETTYHAYHVIDAHIIGFSLWQSTHDFALPDEATADMRGFLDRILPEETYPDLHAHGIQHLETGPLHETSAFEYGLDLVLAGLERQRTPE